jgi:Rod binding domain-containing protein
MDTVNLPSANSRNSAALKPADNSTVGTNSNTPSQDEVVSVARQFEALMLHTMLKSMRATIVEDELTGSDQQGLYRDMMDQEIAKNISESGGIGIQAVLAQQLGATMNVDINDQPQATAGDASQAKLARLQHYQQVAGASDLMFNTQTSLMQE